MNKQKLIDYLTSLLNKSRLCERFSENDRLANRANLIIPTQTIHELIKRAEAIKEIPEGYELLSDEWIVKNAKSIHTQIYKDGEERTVVVSEDKLRNLLIPTVSKMEKVTVPKFVAEWIELYKNKNYSLYCALDDISDDNELYEWTCSVENQDTFARAWLIGYDIAPSFIVKVGNNLILSHFHDTKAVFVIDNQPTAETLAKVYSNQEDAERDAELVGGFVEEVE